MADVLTDFQAIRLKNQEIEKFPVCAYFTSITCKTSSYVSFKCKVHQREI